MSDVVIVAVKPQDIDEVLHEIKLGLGKNSKKIIVSIAAGISTRYIEKRLVRPVAVIRAMPNMPVCVGKGITALSKGVLAKRNDLLLAQQLFEALGAVIIVQESLMDAVTAVSGSGPAYVYYFIQSLVSAAKKQRLSQEAAMALVLHTIIGSVLMMAEQHVTDCDALIKRIASKGGTTQAALEVLRKKQFKNIIEQAVAQARKKGARACPELKRSFYGAYRNYRRQRFISDRRH